MTSDNQSEIFDVVDLNDNVIGQATRGEVHSNSNLIHRSIAVAVFNSNKKIFLQRRSFSKDTDPLLWTVSCSGHVLTGESYEVTAIRELSEELGIENVKITFLTKYIYKSLNETEITSFYKLLYDGEIILQKDEIMEGKFFSKGELNSDIATKKIDLNLFGRIALNKLNWLIGSQDLFTK